MPALAQYGTSGAGTMTREEAQREMARQAAIDQAGYDYILLQATGPKRKLGAVDTVVAEKRSSVQGGEIYVPKVVSNDEFFRPGPGGRPTCHLLDTPFNRAFLASHHGLGIWKILDDKIDSEIAKQAQEMRDAFLAGAQIPTPPPSAAGAVNTMPVKVATTDDDIDREIRDLQARKAANAAKRAAVAAGTPGPTIREQEATGLQIPVRQRRSRRVSAPGQPANTQESPVGRLPEAPEDAAPPADGQEQARENADGEVVKAA